MLGQCLRRWLSIQPPQTQCVGLLFRPAGLNYCLILLPLNPFSAGTVLIRQNLTSEDHEDGLRTEKNKRLIMAIDQMKRKDLTKIFMMISN